MINPRIFRSKVIFGIEIGTKLDFYTRVLLGICKYDLGLDSELISYIVL